MTEATANSHGRHGALAHEAQLEDIVNALTHALGLLLGVGGTAVLLVFASLYGTAWHVTSFAVYGASLVLLYAASTVYHATRHERRRRVWRVVDHAAIFMLIAGTYTPYTLVTLQGAWGWSLFGTVWALAVAGTVLKVFFAGRYELLSTMVYLGMGWMGVVAFVPLQQTLPTPGLVWLILGGVVYSIGTIFFLWERQPFTHAAWHVFVLGGSTCHYFSILFFVLAPATGQA